MGAPNISFQRNLDGSLSPASQPGKSRPPITKVGIEWHPEKPLGFHTRHVVDFDFVDGSSYYHRTRYWKDTELSDTGGWFVPKTHEQAKIERDAMERLRSALIESGIHELPEQRLEQAPGRPFWRKDGQANIVLYKDGYDYGDNQVVHDTRLKDASPAVRQAIDAVKRLYLEPVKSAGIEPQGF